MSFSIRGEEEAAASAMPPLGEINVTPFVDVMLVLLIVFMVTAPMLASGIKIDLPKATGLAALPQSHETLILSLRADGSLALGPDNVSRDALEAIVRQRVQADPAAMAHIRADASVPYEKVLDAMAILSRAGVARIAFIGRATAASTPVEGGGAKP